MKKIVMLLFLIGIFSTTKAQIKIGEAIPSLILKSSHIVLIFNKSPN